ncbi:hypothetical protein [Paenibacillus eucommiae]|uniref:Uncharacterized protein n=1 Tax=Paenibacillus eucommiae TaxID=1355755 RepID=A0ABS4J3T0_9BACL|nr:DUF1793 domain-containing protein [Paenibacillus eucommiae]MBP1994497.1 hypothetical protein [Paenibacillus eucommiae]
MNQHSDRWDKLRVLTRQVVEASRIQPEVSLLDLPGGEELAASQPSMPVRNTTGITLIRPGGGSCYPSFWIRDFAMSLDSGMISAEELLGMLRLTASTQNGRTPIELDEGVVPAFAVADHINLDGQPVFYPGTYSPGTDQAGNGWGEHPPYCDQFYFIEMAHFYIKTTGNQRILMEMWEGIPLLERLEGAFLVPAAEPDTGIVYSALKPRAVNFGFVDSIIQTGSLLFSTLLKYRSSILMAEIMELCGQADQAEMYIRISRQIRHHVPLVFGSDSGWLLAATEYGRQPDVWGTAYAIYLDLLEDLPYEAALAAILDGYRKGTTCLKGNVRHVPTDADASKESVWEKKTAEYPINTYQNGAYWGTPAGWYMYALSLTDPDASQEMFEAYVDGMLEEDYRKQGWGGAPWECIHHDGNYRQNGVYMTSVATPYGVLLKKFG